MGARVFAMVLVKRSVLQLCAGSRGCVSKIPPSRKWKMKTQAMRTKIWLAGFATLCAIYLSCVDILHATAFSPTLGAGGDHSCAVVDCGIRCWGSNAYGQLGNSGVEYADSATDVATLRPGSSAGVTSVAVGLHHSCAIVSEQMLCWGRNSNGQLGLGDTVDRAVPTPVL